MATYLKQIEHALEDIIQKDDIHLLTESLLCKLEADAFLTMEAEDLITSNKEKLAGLINHFWRVVLTGTPGRKFSTTHLSFIDLHQEDTRNWLDLFRATIDENFSGILAEIIKTKVAIHIHTFAGPMRRSRQKQRDFAIA
jgi:hypothetical protein